jgi:hypothetical protein
MSDEHTIGTLYGCTVRSIPTSRSFGRDVGSVHAISQGMQNIAATVWLRNVTMDRSWRRVGQGPLT